MLHLFFSESSLPWKGNYYYHTPLSTVLSLACFSGVWQGQSLEAKNQLYSYSHNNLSCQSLNVKDYLWASFKSDMSVKYSFYRIFSQEKDTKGSNVSKVFSICWKFKEQDTDMKKMLWCQWVSATSVKWGWEHDKCQKWHCKKMRAGAALTPGDSPLLKERDKHSVYLCCVFCVCVCVLEREFDKSSGAQWVLCLCYSDNGALTQMKKIRFFLLCQTLLSFPLQLSAFLHILPSLSLILHLHISAFLPLSLSLFFPPSPLVFISLPSPVFILSLTQNFGMWAADSEEWRDASIEREEHKIQMQ